MHPIAPDILTEAHGLSAGACAVAAVLGLVLWLFGWRWHRFWTVAAITVAGGLYGLLSTLAAGWQVLAVGLLLAVSSGLLALELARLLAFAAGGTAAWLAAAALFHDVPATGVVFLAGGLTGVIFYRLWIMVLTSFIGTLIFGHSALLLAETLMTFDAADWAGRNPIGLGVAVGLATLLGLAAQGTLARRRGDSPASTKPKKDRERVRPAIVDEDDLPPDLQALRDGFRRKAEG
jgi:hypothetical protein